MPTVGPPSKRRSVISGTTEVSDEAFKELVARSTTIALVIRGLGRALVGSNYRYVTRRVTTLSLDTSHWKCRAYSSGNQLKRIQTNLLLVEGGSHSTKLVKRAILREKLIPETCSECGIGPTWNNKPLVLRLDHKNGIRNDHRLENLRFLCPNCDSQSSTYCGRNKSKSFSGSCLSCGVVTKNTKRCKPCAKLFKDQGNPSPTRLPQKTKIQWPPTEELLTKLKLVSFSALSKELGVSDNGIRKHLRSHARVVEGRGF